jgi:hypothetical protein
VILCYKWYLWYITSKPPYNKHIPTLTRVFHTWQVKQTLPPPPLTPLITFGIEFGQNCTITVIGDGSVYLEEKEIGEPTKRLRYT